MGDQLRSWKLSALVKPAEFILVCSSKLFLTAGQLWLSRPDPLKGGWSG
jgi:hypothetical protein